MADEGTSNPASETTTTSDTAKDAKSYTPRDEVAKQAENPDAVQNALNAERKAAREAAKRAEAAEARIREFEEKDASEVERLTKRAERAEQQMKDAQAVLLRFEVATEKKVPAELTPLLTGSTKEELESQATLLLDATAKKLDFDGGVREPAPAARSETEQFNDVALQALGLLPEQPK